MNTPAVAHYIFNTHHEAQEATKLLSQAGFDIKKLSIVGKGYHSEEHPLGFYTSGDKIKLWGSTGAFWGGTVGHAVHAGRIFCSRFWPLGHGRTFCGGLDFSH